MIAQWQIDQFHQQGFLVVEEVLSSADIAALQSDFDGWVEESREAAKHDATGMEALLAAERGDLETLRTVLAKDPKAANGKRWTSGTRKGSMRALTAGEERNTCSAITLSGVRAFCCKMVKIFLSILSMSIAPCTLFR